MGRKLQLVHFVALTVVATALAGCGSDSASGSSSSDGRNASAEVRASLAAARQAKTFRLVATGTDSGAPLNVDLHFGSNGADGTVETQGSELALKFVGSTVYFKAPPAFWRKQAGSDAAAGNVVARQFGDKWVKTTRTSEAGKGFAGFGSGAEFLKQFTSGFDDAQGARQLGASSVGGAPTKTYTDSSNEGTIDVASSGTPYPLKVVLKPKKATDDRGTVTLSEWNKPFIITAPANSVTLPS